MKFSGREIPPLWRVFLAMGVLLVIGVTGAWALPAETALLWLTRSGYWFILAAFACWVWSLVHVLPRAWRAFAWQRDDRWGVLAIVVGGGILLAHEPAGFKILMDEIHLLGTSMAMHWQRAVFLPQQASDLHGIFELTAGAVDKRPVFFPFLVSILHDVIGYRPENPFVLNGILTFVLLTLSYVAGRALGGWRAGLFAVIAWTALPLLGQNASGGGFEILNVVMILATALLAGWHYRERDDWSLTALVFSGLLLAQTRYESPLFLLAVAGVVLLVWLEARAVRLPWLAVISPVFLLPVVLLNRVFEARPGSWELAGQPGAVRVFAAENVPDNLGHALFYWFGAGAGQPNAPLLSGLGLLAVVAALILLPRVLRQWRGQTAAVKTAYVFGGAVLAHLTVMLAYFWGKFDDPVIHRLSLPEHLLFALGPLLVLALVPALRRGLDVAIAVAALALVATGLPSMARQATTRLYSPALDTAWRREFIQARPERDFLFLDQDATFWITHKVSATPILLAKLHPDAVAFDQRNRTFNEIYVFQRLAIDPVSGVIAVRPDDDLGPAYELEPVDERLYHLNLLSRISRVKSVTPALAQGVGPTPASAEKPEKSPEQRARDNALLEEWLKKLP